MIELPAKDWSIKYSSIKQTDYGILCQQYDMLKYTDNIKDLKDSLDILRQYQMKLNPLKFVFRVTSRIFMGFMVHYQGIEVNPTKIGVILEMVSPQMKEVQSLIG